MKYLLDTNINKKLKSLNPNSIFISEITLAELKFGIANSNAPSKNLESLAKFLTGVQILPIFESLDVYAKEKARLRKEGRVIDDFDLLIGASAIANDLILITNNVKHFKRLNQIQIENWALQVP